MKETLQERLQREAREYLKQYRRPEDNMIVIDDITANWYVTTLIAHTIAETIKAGVSVVEALKEYPVPDGFAPDGFERKPSNEQIKQHISLTAAATALQGLADHK